MNQQPIQVTEAAKTYLANKLSAEAGKIFRVTVKKTGCSGYAYTPEVVDTVKAGDIPVILTETLTIYIDASWMHLLEGVTIDYLEEEKMGLKQKKLIFINPKESGRCGCGESFHVS